MDFACGWLGGVVGVLFSHPLDTVRTVQATSANQSPLTILTQLMANTKGNRIAQLYAGVYSPCLSVGLWKSTTLGLHQTILNSVAGGSHRSELSVLTVAASASLAGSISSSLCSPFELIKSRAMLSKNKQQGSNSVLRHELGQITAVVSENGFRGFSKGMGLLLLRDCPGTAAFLGSYEVVKRLAQQSFGKQSDFIVGFTAGAVAGPVGWIVCYPVEVVRIHWQANGVNGKPQHWATYRACARSLYAQYGWRVFFRGLPTCCVRSTVQISTTMATFEVLCQWVRGVGRDG